MNGRNPRTVGPGRRTAPAGLRAGAPGSFIRDAQDALLWVSDDLRLAEESLRTLVRSDVAAIPEIAGYLAQAGGKRLRPALTALGARAVGLTEPMPGLMCCGELIHLGSLLHDDVVDEADTRRGQAAAHTVYGNGASVLTGDFCLARAVLLASEEGGHLAVTALAKAVTEMAEGEVLQLYRAGDIHASIDDYYDVIERKSAALIAWCAAAGAWSIGDRTAAAALETYGRAVGTAFQIADDILDFEEGTGKIPGADLRERKLTLPLLYALERVDGLGPALAERAPTPDEVGGWVVEIRESGALDAARSDARRFVDKALLALHALPDSDGRRALEVLGAFLVERAR